MSSLLLWARVAALVWVAALAIVLLAELRQVQRLIPDWLRNLSRAAVLIGTVGLVTMTVIFGVRMMASSLEARAEAGGGPELDLSFDSPNSFFLSLYLSTHQAELNQSVSDDPTPVTFAVESGETATEVAGRLEEAGLVVDGEVFRRFMTYHGLDVSLEAGTYSLRPNMTMHEIAEALQHGGADTVTVTIPEGWRMEQTAWLLEEQGLMRGDDFLAYARTVPRDYAWQAEWPPDASSEGFLFPDTYELDAESTPADLVDLMLATFDARAAPEIESRLAGRMIFDLEFGDYRSMTVYDVITLASIVEREAVVDEERPIIASVYYNRLDPAYVEETALRLSSDPTVQYVKGYDPETGNWWNPMLPGEGQTIESPYNTFQVQGLPPGPICSPGLASILAVLNPSDTDYLYFHAIGDGSHVFASTLDEHLQNQEQYTP
ncbi:MAG: endolytic transglycosylase MltG [Anaerolineae bacterium]